MKVLVSTSETQGLWGKLDFIHVPEGELVGFGMECDSDERWDGPCGCRRSMVGLEHRTGTTSFKVEDRPDMTPEKLLCEVTESYIKGGWAKYDTVEQTTQICQEGAMELARLASLFPPRTVLGKRGNNIVVRKMGDVPLIVRIGG